MRDRLEHGAVWMVAGSVVLACILTASATVYAQDKAMEDGRSGADVADRPAESDPESEAGIGRTFDAFRERTEAGGLSVSGAYTAEFSGVVDGGIRRRFDFRNLLTIDAEVDLDAVLGWDGASVFVQYASVNGEGGLEGGSNDAGDTQGYSNIESRRHLDVLYELWFQQELLDDSVRVKLGKVDANSEFAFVDAAGDFANSSAGFSPTIFALPTYPDSATSVNVFATLLERDRFAFDLSYGFYDGALAADGVETGRRGPSTFFGDDLSDDYFQITQADVRWAGGGDDGWWGDGSLSAGGWFHDGTFDRFDGGRDTGVFGVFATLEQRVWASGDRSFDAFAQFGWADDRVSEIGLHAGLGIVAGGLIPSRENDRLGVYVSLAVLSDEPGAGFEDDELVIDAYYRAQLTGSIFVQPEVQYIINPGGAAGVDDALVLGIRAGIDF